MKRWGLILLIALALLGLLAALFYWQLNKSLNRATNPARPAKAVPPPVNVPAATPPTKVATNRKQKPGGVYEPRDPRWQWWNEQKKIDPKFEWKMPIAFYGLVVDESERPVPGAIVKLQWNDLSQAGTSYAEALTAAEGRFSLENVTGKMLEVRVSKEGYEALDYVKAFEYAAFFEKHFYTPDPDAPIVFKLRKRMDAEPLIVRQTLYGFKVDGTPHRLADGCQTRGRGRRRRLDRPR